jgi:hypothetical protein
MPIGDIFVRCLEDVQFYLSEGRNKKEIIKLVSPRIIDALAHYEFPNVVPGVDAETGKETTALFIYGCMRQKYNPSSLIDTIYKETLLEGIKSYQASKI